MFRNVLNICSNRFLSILIKAHTRDLIKSQDLYARLSGFKLEYPVLHSVLRAVVRIQDPIVNRARIVKWLNTEHSNAQDIICDIFHLTSLVATQSALEFRFYLIAFNK